ncbi:MAG: c-type cytochrome, partial [Rhizobiaceae bacterium]
MATIVGVGNLVLAGAALADGKQAFIDANCGQCHSVTSEGITAKV